jgi:uncharacterized membrane protein YgdD (TMEM256/DUF423 family)
LFSEYIFLIFINLIKKVFYVNKNNELFNQILFYKHYFHFMKKYVLAGGGFALLSVVLGAFASHALKSQFSTETLQSFQTGVRYMMYHGLALLTFCQIPWARNHLIFRLFFWGTILFSLSIFLLCLAKFTPYDLSWLGPVTPVGGSLLILGWVVLIWRTLKNKKD